MAADWQGNVRELENVVEQAVILCPEGRTDLPLSSLPARLGGEGWQLDAAPGAQRPATLDEVERQYILGVLRQSGGNKAQAARILDIDYKTLLRKLDAAAAASAE
jgi:DNA-binding NtrC family response regulator